MFILKSCQYFNRKHPSDINAFYIVKLKRNLASPLAAPVASFRVCHQNSVFRAIYPPEIIFKKVAMGTTMHMRINLLRPQPAR